MRQRRLHCKREEDDPGHHRQMQVGVDIPRKRRSALRRFGRPAAAGRGSGRVEVREPERRRDGEPEHRGDDHAGVESAVAIAEADRDQGFADRDDHYQPVTFDEVRRLRAASRSSPPSERPEEADCERGHPEHRLQPPWTNPATMIRAAPPRPAGMIRRIAAEQVSIAALRDRVQRDMHDVHDQERDPEYQTVAAERFGNGERGHEHPCHRNREALPTPRPHRDRRYSSTRHTPPTPTRAWPGSGAPDRVRARSDCGQERRDLREREHEDEIEEQLERRDALLALGMLLAHSRTLARIRTQARVRRLHDSSVRSFAAEGRGTDARSRSSSSPAAATPAFPAHLEGTRFQAGVAWLAIPLQARSVASVRERGSKKRGQGGGTSEAWTSRS